MGVCESGGKENDIQRTHQKQTKKRRILCVETGAVYDTLKEASLDIAKTKTAELILSVLMTMKERLMVITLNMSNKG